MPDGGSSLSELMTILAACSIRASCISSTFAEGMTTATSPWRSIRKDWSWVASIVMGLRLFARNIVFSAAAPSSYHAARGFQEKRAGRGAFEDGRSKSSTEGGRQRRSGEQQRQIAF